MALFIALGAWVAVLIGALIVIATGAWFLFSRMSVAFAGGYLLGRVIMALIVTAALGGCVSMDGSEYLWQATHAVDAAQTLQIAGSACRAESDPATSALIGSHPTKGAVVGWAIGTGYAHAWVSDYLARHDYTKTRAVWQITTVSLTFGAVAHNQALGIGVGNDGCTN